MNIVDKIVCDDCGACWELHELADIKHYAERVGAGCTVEPIGQCPTCGALCYLQSEIDKADEERRRLDATIAWIRLAVDVLEDAKDRFEILEDASEATPKDSKVLDRIRAVLKAHARVTR